MSTVKNQLLQHKLPQSIVAQARNFARDLCIASERRQLTDPRLLIGYGGGKDSSFVLAFVCLASEIAEEEHGIKWRLRVVTNHHAGMPTSVSQNIHRAYSRLSLYGSAELLSVEDGVITDFDAEAPISNRLAERNRLEVLMNGHRSSGDARSTFCIACNFSMLWSFERAASWNGGVDFVITGDSRDELAAYSNWVESVATALQIQPGANATYTLAKIYERYVESLAPPSERRQFPGISGFRSSPIEFFSIFQYTDYSVEYHGEILSFLGFDFDETTYAFSFTETDCANPMLMCHLRGLKKEHVYNQTYDEGVQEYLAFAIGLMRKKEFSPALIQQMKRRYGTPEGRRLMRRSAENFALQAFSLSEQHLIAMLFSPLINRGRNLAPFLSKLAPDLVSREADIRILLAGNSKSLDAQQTALKEKLEKLIGLSISYQRALFSTLDSPSTLRVLSEGDPHRGVVETGTLPDGSASTEEISGR